MNQAQRAINRFPINFFRVMPWPTRIFTQSRQFKGWQQLFLILFLTGCMALPLSLSLTRATHAPMTLIAPKIEQVLSQSTFKSLDGAVIRDGQLNTRAAFQSERMGVFVDIDPERTIQVTGSVYHRVIPGHAAALIFQKKQLILSQRDGFGFTVRYPADGVIRLDGSGAQLIHQIEQMWFVQYQSLYRIVLSCFGFAALLLTNCFLFLILTLLLWLTKWTKLSDIQSFRQASSIVILSAALPTLLASLLSLYQFNFGTMMLLQSAGLSLMIACVFFRTRFQNSKWPMREASRRILEDR
ncbi:MAG: hypothetical protein ABF683_04170 [Sporolactobacillus sp.]